MAACAVLLAVAAALPPAAAAAAAGGGSSGDTCAAGADCDGDGAARDVIRELGGFRTEAAPLGEWPEVDLSPFGILFGPGGFFVKTWGLFKWLFTSGRVLSTMKYMGGAAPANVTVHDARAQERREGVSKREFMERYGFVLVPHQTALQQADWAAASIAPHVASTLTQGEQREGKRAALQYAGEVEGIVRSLFPQAKRVNSKGASVLHRGPGTSNNLYGFGVHQDYALNADDYDWAAREQGEHDQWDGRSWRAGFDERDVAGMMVVNLWRPVRPMQGPVRKQPLAVLDPRTVDITDVSPKLLFGFGGTEGLRQMDLRHSAGQRWYYYPDMTVGEVLVFKQFEWFKNRTGARPEVRTCFHTAFNDTAAPTGAEDRTSSEFRVEVYF